ncbi:signal transduction histidine kinase/ligand-binding sensor domain-containing protein [Silvibacterium bohemicum]|uniref:Signal transduction histidine kinase/ligand-binding sensor domain-containing protein n=1 Tax=Silvibacterium bohemicum TaxID=1577686 RepID=A0A841JTP6_9BACT|nr:sensor histidine kinase [Silvibacterium bohemicum]MBB6144530.1 signal transduction histidine kinase/ligand-binding sensor domain-containing protein [Silvibacterium bohemicum]
MKVVRTLSICSFLLWLVATANALNPDRDIHQLAHRSWSQTQGYPGHTRALAQTRDGFLWLGSDTGLFRFDGVHFERYVPRSGDKPSEDIVRSLLALPDGSLWIAYAHNGKICVLRNGNVKCYGKTDGVTWNPTDIVQDHEGTIWANTESGVIRFNGTRWEHVGKNWDFPEDVPHMTSRVLFVDSRGTLWVGVNSTILYLKQGSKRFEPTGAFAGFSLSIAEAPDGTIWLSDNAGYVRAIGTSVSTKSATIAKCEADTLRGAHSKCPSERSLVIEISGTVRIMFDHNGSLWTTTDSLGVVRVPHPDGLRDRPISKTSDALQRFTSKDGLSADNCTPILEDREGNIWVATRDGLDQFRDTALVPVVLPKSIVQTAIAPADNGDIWAAVSSNYVGRIHSRSKNLSLVPADAFKPYRDFAGVTWLMGNSLAQWKEGRFRQMAKSPEGLSGSFGTWEVAGDRFGTLWAFASGYGFFSLDHHRWKVWPTPPEVAKQHVLNMFSDSTGRIWVSTYQGDIITMDKGSIVDYLAKDSRLNNVKAFAEHAPQEIWAGGAGGLLLIDRGHFRLIKSAGLGALEDVTGIVDAGSEGLWLNTAGGVIHVSKHEAEHALRDPSYRFQWKRFDSSDGLPGQAEATGPYPKAIEGTDGRIWFTSTTGLAWVDPNWIPKNTLPPPISITSVSADDLPQVQKDDLRLPAHTANVQVSYTALSLSLPERVLFKYKLEGSDKDWKDAGTRREAFYTNLSPRHYRFRVIACNNDGIWNNVGANVEFTIAPAWYQTTWFYALCATIGFLILWILYRLRMRQIAKSMSDRFDERLSERTRIARDFHDTLLQTIQGTKLVADSALKQSADSVRMRGAMEQVSVWMGQATEEGRAALNSLRTSTTETNDLAEAFRRSIEECRIHGSMEAKFSVVGEVSEMHPIVRDEVYRIGYEAIRNACVHSKAANLQVELTYAENLILGVHDDGVGIDPAIVDEGKEGHFGLQGMRERAGRIMAKLTFETSAVSGTEIKLVVPGSIIYLRATSSRRKLPAIKSILKWMGLTSNSTDS